MGKRWTNNEIDEAINLVETKKLTFEEIGKKLNRTTKSIRVKLNRLGYKEHKYAYWEKKKCECCGNEFESLKTEKRRFCSQSCSAKITNIERTKYRYCKCCANNKLTSRQEYFCSHKCQQKYKRNEVFKKIDNNETINYLGNNDTQSKWFKKYLIEKHGEKCMKCGWNERHPITGKVPIELEHKDGNSENNSLDNLELLCPNCHSLTPTYKALNTGNGRHKRRERYKNGKSF